MESFILSISDYYEFLPSKYSHFMDMYDRLTRIPLTSETSKMVGTTLKTRALSTKLIPLKDDSQDIHNPENLTKTLIISRQE